MANNKIISEFEVETKFIETIQKNWYTFNELSSYEELKDNFRRRLNELNKDVLNGNNLTDEEFFNICNYLENKTVFDASKILRGEKIDVIKRNDSPLYLKLIDLTDIGKNKFEVAHQITTKAKYLGRFDVTLLINGLPFVQIELKRPGVEINEAFNQVLRYKRDGNYNKLFSFIQIFVISNVHNTKYFANNDFDINKSSCFFWTYEDNQRINDLYEFEKEFLFCPFLFKMVFKYMVASASQKKLYVLRPYQMYALEKLLHRCLKENSHGYCFHSTGSGKTLTSFKFAYEISKSKEIDKVFFLVDRKDLDDKTVDDFNSYMSSTFEEFTNINKTEILVKKILSNDKLIIATINKMYNALKSAKTKDRLSHLKDRKIVFMFDECHRTQAGDMRKLIQQYFTNALFYGFTGTPIFDDEDARAEQSMLTSKHFGQPVHIYTLKDAIGDHNVLPLCIDYVNTIKLKDNIISDIELDKMIQGIDKTEVLLDDRRVKVIVESLLSTFDIKTINRTYNAIFACESIKLLLKYYKELINNNKNLKIAAIYTYNSNEDCKEGDDKVIAKDELSKIIDEYNKRSEDQLNFSLTTYSQYERHVINNFRNKNIDILLVVDKCLTGMDFVRCNTIYLDKSMKMHGLIQAISRTIRTYKEDKFCGNVICYQTSKATMEKALAHFNNDKDVYAEVTLLPLDELIKDLNEQFKDCVSKIDLANSRSEQDKRDFVNSFRKLMHTYNKAKNYIDFDINNTDVDMITYNQLMGYYKDIYNEIKPHRVKESILNDIDFEIELLEQTTINFDYIIDLLRKSKDNSDKKECKITRDKILKIINKSPISKPKKEFLIKFVKSFMDKNIEGLYTKDPEEEYIKFYSKEKDDDINNICKEYGVDVNNLKEIIGDFAYKLDTYELKADVTNLLSSRKIPLKERILLSNNIEMKITNHVERFSELAFF